MNSNNDVYIGIFPYKKPQGCPTTNTKTKILIKQIKDHKILKRWVILYQERELSERNSFSLDKDILELRIVVLKY